MKLSVLTACLTTFLAATGGAQAATLEAAYTFNNDLNAVEGGAPALTASDPLGTNAYGSVVLYGQNRSVYAFNSSAGNNAGLTFNDSSNLVTPDSYSVEMVFDLASLSSYSGSGWLRLLDSQNRQSDQGFYVDPNHKADIFNDGAGTSIVSADTYYDLILTNDGTTSTVYLNGAFEFSVAQQGAGLNQMNLNNANNPGQLLNLFLDNTVGGGEGEFTSGNIALFEAFDGVLSAGDAATLAADPYANVPSGSTVTPEPATWLLLAGGFSLLAFRKQRVC